MNEFFAIPQNKNGEKGIIEKGKLRIFTEPDCMQPGFMYGNYPELYVYVTFRLVPYRYPLHIIYNCCFHIIQFSYFLNGKQETKIDKKFPLCQHN